MKQKNQQSTAATPQTPTISLDQPTGVAMGDALDRLDDRDAINASCTPYSYDWPYTHEAIEQEIAETARSQQLTVQNSKILDSKIENEFCGATVGDLVAQSTKHIEMIFELENKELSAVEKLGEELKDLREKIDDLKAKIKKAESGWLL